MIVEREREYSVRQAPCQCHSPEDQDTAVGWGSTVYLLAESDNGIGFTNHGPTLANLGTQAEVFVLQDLLLEAVCNH